MTSIGSSAQRKSKVKLCPTLCDPMDCSLPGSSVHGIFQARILEWVAHFLLQEIFLTQELNPGLLPCRQMLYCPSHKGSLSCTKFLSPAHTLWTALAAAPLGIARGMHLLPCSFPGRSSQLPPLLSVVWIALCPARLGASSQVDRLGHVPTIALITGSGRGLI